MNMQPSEAEAGFDVRLPPTTDSDMLKRRIAEEWAPAIRNMTYEVIMLIFVYSNQVLSRLIFFFAFGKTKNKFENTKEIADVVLLLHSFGLSCFLMVLH